jgi:hypothetical protein
MLHKHSKVGIVTRLPEARSRVRILTGARDFSPLQIFHTVSEAQPAYYTVSFPVERRPGRETDHLLPSSAKVKNEWSYTSIPHTPS